MKKIVVLGAGLVGRTIALDLARDYNVVSVDSNPNRLKSLADKNIDTMVADLSSQTEIKRVIKDFDLVIGALPGFMGFNALKSIIEAGKNVVDISFFPEDPFLLDELAKEKNITAIVDCGVSPGLSNIFLGYHNTKMKVDNYRCIVGGLPYKREWPFEYKAYFSPIDVIEEYIRPARIVIDGNVVEKPALSESEIINFKEVGDLEAFNTDGLRSLIKTMNVPNMIEKTLRYPGHIELMKIFREVGFFGDKEIEINGKRIKPVELTSKLLFSFWLPEIGEQDFTILDVLIEGKEKEKKSSHRYFIFDSYDTAEHNSSMARTTGFTCCAAARFLLENNYDRRGICPPEFLGENENCFNYIISYLKNKRIRIDYSKK
ncbi:MAG TPA: saccharopine dehydrogenase C-terminal domain-containing protein [Ignavibacteriaceae bacterium]